MYQILQEHSSNPNRCKASDSASDVKLNGSLITNKDNRVIITINKKDKKGAEINR